MPLEEVWLRVAHECPRRIIATLHRSGEYVHGTTPRFPAKVLCCHRDTPLPEDWIPTPTQEQACQVSRSEGQVPPEQEDGHRGQGRSDTVTNAARSAARV